MDRLAMQTDREDSERVRCHAKASCLWHTQMGEALGSVGARLVVLGGVVYSVGGLIYALRWPDPSPKVCATARDTHA